MPLQHAGLAHLFGEAWKRDPSPFDPDVARQIERGLQWSRRRRRARARAGAASRSRSPEFLTRYDLLICPTTPCVAWPDDRLGPEHIGGVAVEPRAHAVFTPFVNHAMAAAISIPCGSGRDGLPVGMQVIAARGHDRQLLDTSKAIEAGRSEHTSPQIAHFTSAMRILVLNPNTSQGITDRLMSAALPAAAAGTELVALTAPRGFPYIATRAEAQIGGAVALEMLAEHQRLRRGHHRGLRRPGPVRRARAVRHPRGRHGGSRDADRLHARQALCHRDLRAGAGPLV